MKICNLLASALLVLTTAGQAFAGYTGPDNVVYDYMIVNWITKSADDIEISAPSYETNWDIHNTECGAAVYGPGGLEDYSISTRFVELRTTTVDHYRYKETSTADYWPGWITTDYTFYENSDIMLTPTIVPSNPQTYATGSYPDIPYFGSGYIVKGSSALEATVTSGAGTITAYTTESLEFTPDVYELGDETWYVTYDKNMWAMVTWTNATPPSPEPPEFPEDDAFDDEP